MLVTVHGQEHPLVADSLFNLAIVHAEKEEWEKVVQLFLECEQDYSSVYGPGHR